MFFEDFGSWVFVIMPFPVMGFWIYRCSVFISTDDFQVHVEIETFVSSAFLYASPQVYEVFDVLKFLGTGFLW